MSALLLATRDEVLERFVVTDGDEPLSPQEFCAKYGHSPVTGGTANEQYTYCQRCNTRLS